MRELGLVFLLACSEMTESPNAPADAAQRMDAAEPTDAAVESPCDRWCAMQADCQIGSAGQRLRDRLVETSSCALVERDASQAECVRACTGTLDRGSCLPCLASCEPNDCTCPGALDRILIAMRDDFTCWAADAPISQPETCERGPLDPRLWSDFTGTFTGTASVLLSSPTMLRLATDPPLEIHGTDFPALTAGATIAVELESECGFICHELVVLRDAGGMLIFAAWRTDGRKLPELPELSIAYDFAPCSSFREPCAQYLVLDLAVARPGIDATPIRIPGGEALELGPYRIVNGDSTFLFEIDCTDTPGTEYSGFITIR